MLARSLQYVLCSVYCILQTLAVGLCHKKENRGLRIKSHNSSIMSEQSHGCILKKHAEGNRETEREHDDSCVKV